MPILADFTIIQADEHPNATAQFGDGTFENPYMIGDASTVPGSVTPQDPNGVGRLELGFGTGGCHHSGGLLSMMINGLTMDSASVRINGHQVGRLQPTPGATTSEARIWRQQQFLVPSNLLNSASSDTANTLVIGRADHDNPSPGNLFDDFRVRDIVCFFHQVG